MFQQNLNIFTRVIDGQINTYDNLPVGNYTMRAMKSGELYLELTEPFQHIPKYYGDIEYYASRIIRTYQDRKRNTGVMLSGEKGTGKTLLARYISNTMKVPTILINQVFNPVELINILSAITTDCLIIFDEFEKTYGRSYNNSEDEHSPQETLLTVLDGLIADRKLFLFITNSYHYVTDFLKNRPGRIFYHIRFDRLQDNFITDYCVDNLVCQAHTTDICRLSALFGRFNFDCLKALVEECNRYNEPPVQALKLLNIDTEQAVKEDFDYTIQTPKGSLFTGSTYQSLIQPIAIGFYSMVYSKTLLPVNKSSKINDNGDEDGWDDDVDNTDSDEPTMNWHFKFMFDIEDFMGIDGNDYVFKNKQGTLRLTKKAIVRRDLHNYMKNLDDTTQKD